MKQQLPIIALVGEPNVGKSTLLNKIAGRQFAITSKVSGTTRDRQYVDAVWNGVDMTLVDTAGLSFSSEQLELELHKQIDIAVAEADMLVLVVDGKLDPGAINRKALLAFRKAKKPIVLAINKVDSPKRTDIVTGEFAKLGIKAMFPVSGLTGKGTGDLLDYIAEFILEHKLNVPLEDVNFGIGVAIVGKPNVGKSSLFNAIIKEERVIVSPIPGTTRAAIDTHIIIDQDDYTFIDTAGLKRKAYRQSQPDVFSGFQTFKSIRRSDVALLVIDATQEITKQDQHLAQEIWTLNKGLIIVANKIDVYEGEEQKLRDYISLHFPFLWMCPMILVSAKNGTGISDLVGAIKPIVTARHKELSDEELQRLLDKTLEHNPPKLMRDQKKPKVIGLKQVDTNPPIFELYVNYPAAISMQYRKFLEKSITRNLGFWGTPIKLRLKGKDKS